VPGFMVGVTQNTIATYSGPFFSFFCSINNHNLYLCSRH
jgi:hypothetical protein